MKNRGPYLSVIIPAYNEEINIRKGVLAQVYRYLENQKYDYEVIIVDDGSSDRTLDLLTRFKEKHPKFRITADIHNGKAFSILRGIQEAKGDIVLFMDMDQATPIRDIEKLLPEFKKGFDIVIGSRGSKRTNAPIGRQILSKGQVLLRNVILGFKDIHDTQCGFKAFRYDVLSNIVKDLHIFSKDNAQKIDFPAVSAGFDVELLFVATKLGYRIKEVPVIWDYRMSRRVNLVKDAIRSLKELLQLKLLDLRGKYRTD